MLRIVRDQGQGAPVTVTLRAAQNQQYQYGTLVALNAQGLVVPSNEFVLGIVASPGAYGTPRVVDVQLIAPTTLLEATEAIQQQVAEFNVGELIWVLPNGNIGRPPQTPPANASYYLVTKVTTLSRTNPAPTDIKNVSYLVVPHGLNHGWANRLS